mmetsp:Transcript_5541/g.17194  ORF Transcript_5541/g.17194 Transcript_5541/m.17194 type:complete len:213 (+) Transcript_5541:198-836(+)
MCTPTMAPDDLRKTTLRNSSSGRGCTHALTVSENLALAQAASSPYAASACCCVRPHVATPSSIQNAMAGSASKACPPLRLPTSGNVLRHAAGNAPRTATWPIARPVESRPPGATAFAPATSPAAKTRLPVQASVGPFLTLSVAGSTTRWPDGAVGASPAASTLCRSLPAPPPRPSALRTTSHAIVAPDDASVTVPSPPLVAGGVADAMSPSP